jgi:glycosyltransferase involved in cell wall biosynthesis
MPAGLVRQRVLFVSHQASRAGAPIVLLHFLRWLRENSDLDFQVLLRQGGELGREFAEVAHVISVEGDPAGAHLPMRLLRRVAWADEALNPPPTEVPAIERALRMPARRTVIRLLSRRIRLPRPPDLVYLNCIASAPVLQLIPDQMPVIAYAHELSHTLQEVRQASPATFAQLLGRTDRYLAAADAVKGALVDLGVDPHRIDVCHEFIPNEQPPVAPGAVEAIRRELDLSPGTLVVGSVGTVEWRKAPDLFVQVAQRTITSLAAERDVAFVWVGGPAARDDYSLKQVQHDIEQIGLSDRILFVGARADPRPFMALFDVFALTSREDAFPLSCLEASALRTPVVCFDAGGMREFLKRTERLVVPYLDLGAMVGRICQLLRSESERVTLGQRLGDRVTQSHLVDTVAPILLGHIQRTISNGHHSAG